MPLTIKASESAVKMTFPSLRSAFSHTRLWQPSMRCEGVRYFSSIGGRECPMSMIMAYRSIQSSMSANSSIISFSVSCIVIWLMCYYCFSLTIVLTTTCPTASIVERSMLRKLSSRVCHVGLKEPVCGFLLSMMSTVLIPARFNTT